jgi:hypothetical protein
VIFVCSHLHSTGFFDAMTVLMGTLTFVELPSPMFTVSFVVSESVCEESARFVAQSHSVSLNRICFRVETLTKTFKVTHLLVPFVELRVHLIVLRNRRDAPFGYFK